MRRPGSARAITARYQAKDVYLVLSPAPGDSGEVQVLLDGQRDRARRGGR